MRTEIRFSEMPGRTVEAVCIGDYSSQAVITFTDGTFATIGAQCHFEDSADICEERLLLLSFGDKALISLGIITLEELQKIKDDQKKELQERMIAREREEFLRLKAKFELVAVVGSPTEQKSQPEGSLP